MARGKMFLSKEYRCIGAIMMKVVVALFVGSVTSKPMMAQRAEVYTAQSMPDNSIVYALPQTHIYVQVNYLEVEETPGELALYAQRYLGTKNVVLQSQKRYEIKGVRMGIYGTPDEALRFSVKFGKRHDATNVTLSPEGLLIGINAPEEEYSPLPEEFKEKEERSDRLKKISVFPPEYIQATTTAKKAEIAADEIYRIRESRTIIVSGQSEQPFTDGKAMEIAIERLDATEKGLMEEFIGTRDITSVQSVITEIKPETEGRSVAFRFSEKYGLLPVDDLRGEPIYIDIKIVDQAPILDEKEQKKSERRLSKGIIYRVPGAVQASLSFRGNKIASERMAVAQLGTLEVLDPALFSTKGQTTTVTFSGATGGIKNVKNNHEGGL